MAPQYDHYMAILVVGGAGYIGSHVARALRNSGYEVVIYDNLSTGFRRLAHGFELVRGDIADEAVLRPALARVDAVMHFAAHAYVGESVENPRKYFRNNVAAALNLLNSALDAGIRRIVFSSSCAVYGIPRLMPIDEETPREPVNPYGASKLFFENALEAYGRAYGLRSVILRYFNAAGADQRRRDWRTPQSRNSFDSAGARRSFGERSLFADLWVGLSDSRRHLHTRLHSCERSRRCPCTSVAIS